jgi:hypothetical protein
VRFRKRPVVVEAAQWWKNGDHPEDYKLDGGDNDAQAIMARKAMGWEGQVVRYFRRPDVAGESRCRQCNLTMHVHGWIDTLEGGHIVCPGDFVITGVKGEHYPCKPDVFDATYVPDGFPPFPEEP